jgi:transcriptional regulator with XRE-family HTH domain
MSPTDTRTLSAVGPQLRALRIEHSFTLDRLSELTGISTSTLSRLESGQRKATLELLLPLADTYQVPLDSLVTNPPTADPRLRPRPVKCKGTTLLPLSRHSGGIQAYKQIIPAGRANRKPDPRTHEGYDWLYVLKGNLRLVLGEHDLNLGPGEVAEFDTRVPHWFGSADSGSVEVLGLFGPQGERMHVRARSKTSGQGKWARSEGFEPPTF